jgi:hypothetical protein
MSALNANGQVINLVDQVSIIATVVSTAPFGSTVPSSLAMVTAGTALTTATFVHQANDAKAVQHTVDANHPALSIAGKAYGAAGDQETIIGTVTAISGNGNTASLTVTLASSGLSITVPSGVCNSASAVGGTQ